MRPARTAECFRVFSVSQSAVSQSAMQPAKDQPAIRSPYQAHTAPSGCCHSDTAPHTHPTTPHHSTPTRWQQQTTRSGERTIHRGAPLARTISRSIPGVLTFSVTSLTLRGKKIGSGQPEQNCCLRCYTFTMLASTTAVWFRNETYNFSFYVGAMVIGKSFLSIVLTIHTR